MISKTIKVLSIMAIFAFSSTLVGTNEVFATTNGKLGNACASIDDAFKKLECRREMSDKRDKNTISRFENQHGYKITQEILDLQDLQQLRSSEIVLKYDDRYDILNSTNIKKIELDKLISSSNFKEAKQVRQELKELQSQNTILRNDIEVLVDTLEDSCIELHKLWSALSIN